MTPPKASEIGPIVSHRLRSLDIIRGAVMILMAIDHVRVYSGIPAGGPTAGVFFTRWVTHFCAPAFVFFAGTAAFLHGRKLGDTRTLARYLVIRGLLLVLLELTVIRFSWTFNVDYSQFVLAGVIWMLGWCMVLLAAFVSLKPRTVGIAGVLIVFLQQLFSFVPRALPASIRSTVGPIWEFVYPAGSDGWLGMTVLYTIVPWIGVMAAGYGFGTIVLREPGSPPPALPEDRTDLHGTVRGLRGAHGPADAVRRRSESCAVSSAERFQVSGEPAVPLDDARADDRDSSTG